MKICIVDDHQIIIEGIELLLSLEKQISIMHTFNDGNELIQELKTGEVKPDLVLMDLHMPAMNGMECSKILKKEFPDIKIIILSMNCDDNVVYELIEKIEIHGYLSKNIDKKEMLHALKIVEKGGVYLSKEAEISLSRFKKRIINYPVVKLSSREKEIVKLMMEGFTNREISLQLFISESTVETHRKNIYRKTETHSLPKLIQMVNELKLLEDSF